MPRYFFSLENNHSDRDDEGTVLPDDHTARIEAVAYLAQTLKDAPDEAWDGRRLAVIVSGENREHLLSVVVGAEGPISDA